MKQLTEKYEWNKAIVSGVVEEFTRIVPNHINHGWRTKPTIIVELRRANMTMNADAPLRTRYRKYEFYKGRLCFKATWKDDTTYPRGIRVRPLSTK